jgi:hypothetical protein
MATTIITKFGAGIPDAGKIQKGELAIDLVGSILYTKDGNGTIIQLGGGDVKWSQILDVPPALINIYDQNADGYIDLVALKALAEQNQTDIGLLDTDLSTLAGRVTVNEGNISSNIGRITALEDAVTGNDGITVELEKINQSLDAIQKQVDANKTLSESNKAEIDLINELLDANLTGLVFGGDYNADINQVEQATQAGLNAGLKNGENLPAQSEATKGIYVIITTPGKLSGTDVFSTKNDGEDASYGDWLVSDGVHGWIHLELGNTNVTFSMIGGSARDNDDLEAELDLKMDADGATIECGNYND